MSSINALAVMLMKHYIEHPDIPKLVDIGISDCDNEYVMQILITLYRECHQIYKSKVLNIPDLEHYSKYLTSVFYSVGYIIIMENVNRTQLNQYVHFATIRDGVPLISLNNYHPLAIRRYCPDITCLPQIFNDMYVKRDYIRNFIFIHDTAPTSQNVILVKFQQARINFRK
jgi:hypothetical protein